MCLYKRRKVYSISHQTLSFNKDPGYLVAAATASFLFKGIRWMHRWLLPWLAGRTRQCIPLPLSLQVVFHTQRNTYTFPFFFFSSYIKLLRTSRSQDLHMPAGYFQAARMNWNPKLACSMQVPTGTSEDQDGRLLKMKLSVSKAVPSTCSASIALGGRVQLV